jgi:hypothetical protein
MSTGRDDIARRVARLVGRPARWATGANTVGDYDGRERTLDVFLADGPEQRGLLRLLRPLVPDLERAAGGPVVVVFHTRAETARLYPQVVSPAVLRGARVAASTEGHALRVEPVPVDDVTPVRLIHGGLDVYTVGST